MNRKRTDRVERFIKKVGTSIKGKKGKQYHFLLIGRAIQEFQEFIS